MSSCSAQKTLHKTDNTTLTKKGKNPPDISLDYVVEDLLSYYSGFRYFCSIENQIEKKYSIKKEDGNCWPAGDIKRAWGKTQRMNKSSKRRKCWALAITLQLLKRQMRNEDLMESGNVVQKCAELSLHETSVQLKAERENGREDDSLHLIDDIKLQGASGSAVQCAGSTHQQYSYSTQTHSVSQGNGVQQNWNNYNASYGQPRYDQNTALQSHAAVNPYRRVPTNCIPIPVIRMYGNEVTPNDFVTVLTVLPNTVPSAYKLTDGLPFRLHEGIRYFNTEIRRRKSYVMSFDSRTNNAEWVYEILNQQTLVKNYVRQGTFGGVYDRGHLAAASNHMWCREAYEDTFPSDNIIPQHKQLNRGVWRTLENYCQESSGLRTVRNVHVYTGPIYRNRGTAVTLNGKIVPSDVFKVVIVENEDGTVNVPECFLMPN
ncbi:uncharacterized protein LOC130220704 [Danio aesculapii]|uniref:uncharacterized protein LOC130220704 n=1 Tax=Danio aesculapii TaxID=1142201 RepID=UPI0024C0B14A|nr:uncharacterized protein LOC130220704 [Danio aesculapii]XP_056308906.1 uncharacterized protein LOC130220704 [Danio aesculapii]